MRTDALSREDWLVGGLALLLAIDLLFLPWFSYRDIYSVDRAPTRPMAGPGSSPCWCLSQ